MALILIGNLIALIASIIMVYSGILKEKKKILTYQSIEVGLAVIAYLFLNGISGAVINLVSFTRNYLCYKDKLNNFWKVILTITAIILTYKFNNDGIIGCLPLISTIIYLWYMTVKDVVKFKIMIMFCMILWVIYDFTVLNYTACIFDMLTILTNAISITNIKTSNEIYKERLN